MKTKIERKELSQDSKRIARTIRTIRVYNNMSVTELAMKASIRTAKRLNDIESCRVSITGDELISVANALEVNLVDLLTKELKLTFQE